MRIENETFYMNYAEGKSTPTRKFDTLKQAEDEAKRLSEILNCEVFTLQCIQSIKPAPKFITTKFQEYPF